MIRVVCLPLCVALLIGCGGGDEPQSDSTSTASTPEGQASSLKSDVEDAAKSGNSASTINASVNNLKQIGHGLHFFMDEHEVRLPASYTVDEHDEPVLSWRVHILPYLEQEELYDQFHLDEPWDSEHNSKLIEKMPPVYRSPGSNAEEGKTQYLSVSFERGVVIPPQPRTRPNDPSGVRLAAVYDWVGNTIMVVEADQGQAVVWTKPSDFVPDSSKDLCGLKPFRDEKFLALFVDGSVKKLASSLSNSQLMEYFVRDDDHPFPEERQ